MTASWLKKATKKMKPRRPLKSIKAPEQWRQYKETDYWISDQGRVKHVINGKDYEVGYYSSHKSKECYTVKINGKNHIIKNLVYEVYKGKPPKGYCIVHKGGKYNDAIYNLEAVPIREHAHRTGMRGNAHKVADLDKRKVYSSATEASRRLICCKNTVLKICNGKSRKPLFNIGWYDEETGRVYRGEWRNVQT